MAVNSDARSRVNYGVAVVAGLTSPSNAAL